MSQFFKCFSVLERTFYILVHSIESKDFNCNLLLFWHSSGIVFRHLFECTKSLLLLLVSIQKHALGHGTKDCLLAPCYTMLNSRFQASPLMRNVLLWASKTLTVAIASRRSCHVLCASYECVRVYSVAESSRLCQQTCVSTIRIAEPSIATLNSECSFKQDGIFHMHCIDTYVAPGYLRRNRQYAVRLCTSHGSGLARSLKSHSDFPALWF